VDNFASPTRPAVIRGAVQPVIKLGLEHWPNPIAAVVIGYTISSAVLIFAAFVHDPKLVRRFDRRGALWFAAVGLCNGSGVLSLYAALGRGPVTLVAPLFAFLKHEHIGPQLVSRCRRHSRWCCSANYRVRPIGHKCPLLAQSGRHATEFECPLSEVKRT
jgi:hypothetical protein